MLSHFVRITLFAILIYPILVTAGVAVNQCEPEAFELLNFLKKTHPNRIYGSQNGSENDCLQVDASTLNRKEALLVDIRSLFEFELAHIPGSFNSSRSISTQLPHLKDKEVIIVNKGAMLPLSLEHCSLLHQNGFQKVSILKNGINGWHTSGNGINASGEGLWSISLLTPQEIAYLAIKQKIRILFVATHASESQTSTLQNHSHATSSFDDKEILSKLSKLAASSVDPILLVGFQEINSMIIDRYLPLKLSDVYFIEGGAEKFDRFYYEWVEMNRSKIQDTDSDHECRL